MNSVNASTARSSTWFHYFAGLSFVALAAIATSEMRVRPPVPGFNAAFENAVKSSTCNSRPVVREYTGIGPIDSFLQFLVIAFLPGTVGMDAAFQVFELYFLLSFFPIIAIMSIESGRRANRSSWISSPAIYSLLYQTIGGAIILPIYFLLHMFTTIRRPDYFAATSRTVTPAFAKALVPSLILGYLIPTIMLFLPLGHGPIRQQIIAFWQPCPLYVAALLQTFSRMLPGSRSQRGDLKHLNATYLVTGVFSALVHFGILAYCYTSTDSNISLTSVFDPRITPVVPIVAGLKYTFQVDFYGIFTAALVWAYLSVYDLRWAGNTNVSMIKALVYIVVGTFVLGPAATIAATWYWRESVLAKTKIL